MAQRSHLALLVLAAACGGAQSERAERAREQPIPDPTDPALPWAREAVAVPSVESPLVAIRGGTVMTATGRTIENGVVVIEDGRIVAVGPAAEVAIPNGATEVDATGRFLTPGIIDTHSHMGVYAQPGLQATNDGNEATAPVTAEVWAGDSFWPQDAALPRALAGGVTTIQVLPGSANLIGGRGAIVKMHLGRSVSEMLFPGAPDTLKMACGENPKRVYGVDRRAAPSTRMGNVAGYRAAFRRAIEYGRSHRDWQHNHRVWQTKRARFERAERNGSSDGESDEEATSDDRDDDDNNGGDDDEEEDKPPDDPGPAPAPPARDYALETLLGAVEGRVLVQMHCYRADEMARMIELGHELGFRIRSFHHAVEAYKIRDILAREEVSISTWADWWGFKLEAFDAIPENLALITEGGVRGIVHSDSSLGVQFLNQEAAKAMAAGRRAGIAVSDDQALAWITRNAAWALGIDAQTGTLEAGKMADVVVWSASPFSVYARPDQVYVDGLLAYDRQRDGANDVTDFEAGMEAGHEAP